MGCQACQNLLHVLLKAAERFRGLYQDRYYVLKVRHPLREAMQEALHRLGSHTDFIGDRPVRLKAWATPFADLRLKLACYLGAQCCQTRSQGSPGMAPNPR